MLTSDTVKTSLDNQPLSYSLFDDVPLIIISDYSCELSDSVSELNKVKFTWQYADSAGRLATTPDNVFDNTFDPVYS